MRELTRVSGLNYTLKRMKRSVGRVWRGSEGPGRDFDAHDDKFYGCFLTLFGSDSSS